jgi:DNA-binding protein H-NS
MATKTAASGKSASDLDLESLSVEELETLGKAIEAKRQEKLTALKSDFFTEVRDRAAQLGISLAELARGGAAGQAPSSSRKTRSDAGSTRKSRSDAGTKVPVKYRGPNGEAWSGRGRIPKWLAALEAEGRNRESFRT